MCLPSCNIQEKNYARTVPSVSKSTIIQFAFEILNISCINYSAASLFVCGCVCVCVCAYVDQNRLICYLVILFSCKPFHNSELMCRCVCMVMSDRLDGYSSYSPEM